MTLRPCWMLKSRLTQTSFHTHPGHGVLRTLNRDRRKNDSIMASVSTHGNQEKSHHLPPLSKQSLLFCPKSKLHIHRGEIAKIIRECQEESFWKRALPFSLISMLVTQGLVHQGYLAANPRFGSLPKVALAGLLGFGLGKASYIRVCQSKFHSFEDQLRGAGFGPEHNRMLLSLLGRHGWPLTITSTLSYPQSRAGQTL
ncbi:OCIA domain-containing protein 2 isoform X2 [Rattus norvegicus]|uniref:OCIA domain-containing protein 2 isoform X2 n=1 Tax=Rattus norvegicus TaxID=10116 RepID=UPI002FD7A77A